MALATNQLAVYLLKFEIIVNSNFYGLSCRIGKHQILKPYLIWKRKRKQGRTSKQLLALVLRTNTEKIRRRRAYLIHPLYKCTQLIQRFLLQLSMPTMKQGMPRTAPCGMVQKILRGNHSEFCYIGRRKKGIVVEIRFQFQIKFSHTEHNYLF